MDCDRKSGSPRRLVRDWARLARLVKSDYYRLQSDVPDRPGQTSRPASPRLSVCLSVCLRSGGRQRLSPLRMTVPSMTGGALRQTDFHKRIRQPFT